MYTKIIFIFLIPFSSKMVFAQKSFIPGSCYHPNFVLDTTHNVDNEWRYIAKEKDNLFLEESITITRYEVKLKSKKIEEHFNALFEKHGNISHIFYTQMLSKGTSNNKPYYDYLYYSDWDIQINLNYNREYYYALHKNTVYVYTLNYVAIIPRNWWSYEKWGASTPHFLDKINSVKEMYDGCKLF